MSAKSMIHGKANRTDKQREAVRSVTEARRITWGEHDEHEAYGVPAIVRTSSRCRTLRDRRNMEFIAGKCGVKLVPIQYGETMGHGHEAVIAWLAIANDVESLAMLEASKFVTLEQCVSYKIPAGRGVKIGPKKQAHKPLPKLLPPGTVVNVLSQCNFDEYEKWHKLHSVMLKSKALLDPVTGEIR